MGFLVLSNNENDPIYEGMRIHYKVSPILKIPMKWTTRITQVDFGKSFTDLQEKGPYKYWNHFHEFIAIPNGVLMKDAVDYEIPLGLLGKLAHILFVKNILEKIFAYRVAILEKMFNQ